MLSNSVLVRLAIPEGTAVSVILNFLWRPLYFARLWSLARGTISPTPE